MPARNREVCGDGQFFALPRSKQGAIVANAHAESSSFDLGGTGADLAEQVEFAGVVFACFRRFALRSHAIKDRASGSGDGPHGQCAEKFGRLEIVMVVDKGGDGLCR
jgi:hypothetical protein